MTIYLLSFLFGVINVVDYFYVCIILLEALLPCNSRKVRGGDISHFGFLPPVRFRGPDFVGTTGLGCCILPCFLVMFATDWERTFICW